MFTYWKSHKAVDALVPLVIKNDLGDSRTFIAALLSGWSLTEMLLEICYP